MQEERPLWNPYVAGVALGLVLLFSYAVLGFGLGSSGAANRTGIAVAHAVAPSTVENNGYFGPYLKADRSVLDDWLVFEVMGIFLGGAVGAYSAGRLKRTVLKGPNISVRYRLLLALGGGLVMGFAARLARGCTSGQALSGGAVLSVGAWVFMICVFLGGYLIAPVVRRQWQ